MTYGQGTFGQGPYGGTSFDTTGETLVSISPVNGATNVQPTDPVLFTITDPAEFDPWSLSVTIGGNQVIVGSGFLSGYAGSIIFNGQELDVTISTHPPWLAGPNAVAITVTDLAGVPATFNTTFSAVLALTDTVTVTDALVLVHMDTVLAFETVTVTDALTAKYGAVTTESDTVSVTDSLVAREGARPSVSDTVTINEQLQGSTHDQELNVQTVTVTDAVALHHTDTVTNSDTVAVTDALTVGIGSTKHLSETVGVTDSLVARLQSHVAVADTLAVTDAIQEGDGDQVHLFETVPITESVAFSGQGQLHLSETVPIDEHISVGSGGIVTDNTQVTVLFPVGLNVNGIPDLFNYEILPGPGAFPVTILGVSPLISTQATGTNASILDSFTVQIPTASFVPSDLGSYLFLNSPFNTTGYLRIKTVVDGTTVQVDKPLIPIDPMNGSIPWTFTTPVEGVVIQTTKFTDNARYVLNIRGLFFANAHTPYEAANDFTASASKPQVVGVQGLPEGQILVTFSDPMLDDPFLTSPAEYTVTGPTTVAVVGATTISPTTILLRTSGMGAGSYTLTVNATGTPHDSSGNPIDPGFNTAIFTGSIPLTERSIFTDKGPITKPPLVYQTGLTATITSPLTITLPGAALTQSMVGLSLRLTGTGVNGGTYYITAVLSGTQARVKASFHLPDPSNGSISWSVFDPRDGIIADDPTDVVVRINGIPTPAQSVIGLLGQIVMSAAPTHGDDVQVDYSWVCNPTVDFRRVNSKEFRFNNWNRDLGRPNDPSRHKYRFNNTMIQPSSFVPLDIRAQLAQPLLRDLKYRAYERAYSALLNDPNLLLFNSPTNRIAFPPLSRTINSVFSNYQATVLPENSPDPWTRLGTGGTATININELILTDTSTSDLLFWQRNIDLTFPHVFAIAWRMTLNADPVLDGVFTGVAAGYSDDQKAVVVGFLDDGGVHKIGFLKAGSGNDPSAIGAWTGGIDALNNPTNAPFVFDWSIVHSYRLFRDRDGTIRLYVDGSVVESLRITPDQLPFLEELNAPFNELQGAFFGSLSKPATSTSTWDFVRYNILPLDPFQSAPSVFVSFEGTTPPESASQPWTPVGFHGTETIVGSNVLVLDSTSATDTSTEQLAGLISGDFRGYDRIEPLLQASSDVVLDVNVALRTWTHGITQNAVMAAVDDGSLLAQLCFFPDQAASKFSYGGRTFPDQFSPYFWGKLGGATPSLVGQFLRIIDASTSDGLVYFIDDNNVISSPARVVGSLIDYMLEFRVRVIAHVSDVAGFAGVTADVYDSSRDVGVLFQDIAGVKYVTLHSDGTPVAGGQFAFNWDDGQFHTFRITKSTGGNLVTLFADTVLLGSVAYSIFSVPPPSPVGVISFGSSTPTSVMATSTVDWAYCNCWRILPLTGTSRARQYVGLWNGSDPTVLTGYHLPLKANGREVSVVGNALGDPLANFIAAGIVGGAGGDVLIIDSGPNKGVYQIASVTATTLTISTLFPVQPSTVDYRIPSEVDWTVAHRYRIVRDPGGGVNVFLDTNPAPLIRVGYNNLELPPSLAGVPNIVAAGLPSITWGAFDPTNISQTAWDYVCYGITRSQGELGIVPHHQILNQRNVMASYEHHLTNIPHTHTDFWSESEGIPPQTDPDFLRNPGLTAFTLLNEGTPLVPLTQTYEVRRPTPVLVPVAGFNNPQDLLNSQGFVLNESETEIKLIVPPDVLYDSLQVIEKDTGAPDLIAPFDDECEPHDMFGILSFQNEVCLTYNGDVLPENDPNAITPWTFQADDASHVTRSAFAGVLTYGTDGTGTRTIYRNNTPLPDQISLQTQVTFRLKLLNDSSGGLGDSQVRFGFSTPGVTMALAFVTTPIGERYVLVYDLNIMQVVGGLQFDFYDGNYHVYRIVRDPGTASVQVFIDS